MTQLFNMSHLPVKMMNYFVKNVQEQDDPVSCISLMHDTVSFYIVMKNYGFF
jgi:hypothetical protein